MWSPSITSRTLYMVTLIAAVNQVGGVGNCTLCADGSDPTLNPDFRYFATNVTNCSALTEELRVINNFDTLSTSAQCKDLQLEAFQIGCCNHPPYYYCDICPDGSKFKRNNIIDLGTANNPTCGVYEVTAAAYSGLYELGTCNDTFLQRSAHYCGCPVEQQCSLCTNNTPPATPRKGEKYIANTNCGGIEFLYSLFNQDECDTASNGFGVDFAAFCGCEGTNPYDVCQLCPDGMSVKDRDMDKEYVDAGTNNTLKCREAVDYVQYIIRDNICEDFSATPRRVCCTSGARTLGVMLALSIATAVAVLQFLS